VTSHGDGFFTWHAYDPSCKAELWSTGFTHPGGTVLFDPIDWPKDLPLPTPPVQIVRTNENHGRNCQDFCSHPGTGMTDQPPDFTPIPLPGAGVGETAYFHNPTGSLVMGDALINLAPHDLMPLPDKYCTDPGLLGKSLRNLAPFPVRRIFFAHGAPILQDGLSRILHLLP